MDRETLLRTAERLIRQGKLEGAIAEYVRLLKDQPNDTAAINALGDLYLRAGDLDRAFAQFARLADQAYAEGFVPRAAALYRKALRVQPTDEHTLLQLAAIGASQGLPGEARQYLRQVAAQRQARGDEPGVAECTLRLGMLDDADVEARLAAAVAARRLDQPARAATLLKAAAEKLAEQGRHDEARAVRVEAAQLAPGDVRLNARLAREALAAGDLAGAGDFLTPAAAGDDPDLLLALARRQIDGGRAGDAFAALTRCIAVAPDREQQLIDLSAELAARGSLDVAYGCAEIVADAALLSADWPRAVAALRPFAANPPHPPALQKLLAIATEAGLSDLRQEVEALLPGSARGAPAPPGIAPTASAPDAAAASTPPAAAGDAAGALAPTPTDDVPELGSLDLFDTTDWADVRRPAAPADGARESALSMDSASLSAVFASTDLDEETDVLEVDLSEALGEPAGKPGLSARSGGAARGDVALETVFETMRQQAELEQQFAQAQSAFTQGVAWLEQGRLAEAAAALADAARAPLLRFAAAARLGRACLAAGDLAGAIEWLERAASAPPATVQQGHEVRHALADALERTGDTARALTILEELAGEAGSFLDVRERIERLRRASSGSRAT